MAISLTGSGFNFNGNDPYSTPPVYGATTSGSGGTYFVFDEMSTNARFMFQIGSIKSSVSKSLGIRLA